MNNDIKNDTQVKELNCVVYMKLMESVTLHNNDRFIILTFGEGKFIQGKNTIEFLKQSIILVDNFSGFTVSVTHGYVVILRLKDNFFDTLWLSQISDCKIIYEFFSEQHYADEVLFYFYTHDDYMQKYFDFVEENLYVEDEHQDKLCRVSLMALLTNAHRGMKDHLMITQSSMISDNSFGSILKYMGDNFATCTLQSTAEHFNYNPSYLSTYFKKVTGQTFSEKLFTIKLEQGCHLLASTQLTIEEIVISLGFKEKSYFLRRFKKVFGMTPLKYRKLYGYFDGRYKKAKE